MSSLSVKCLIFRKFNSDSWTTWDFETRCENYSRTNRVGRPGVCWNTVTGAKVAEQYRQVSKAVKCLTFSITSVLYSTVALTINKVTLRPFPETLRKPIALLICFNEVYFTEKLSQGAWQFRGHGLITWLCSCGIRPLRYISVYSWETRKCCHCRNCAEKHMKVQYFMSVMFVWKERGQPSQRRKMSLP